MRKIITEEDTKITTNIRLPVKLRNKVFAKLNKNGVTLTALVTHLLSKQRLIIQAIQELKE